MSSAEEVANVVSPVGEDENLNQAMRALAGVSTPRFLAAALGDWLIIVGCMAACVWMPTVWVVALALFIIGTRQHALTVMGHDGTHYMAARNRRLNDFLTGALCFWPIGQTVDGYRRFHFQHHRHLCTDLDPEMPIRLGHMFPMPSKQPWFIKRLLLDLLGLGTTDLMELLQHFKQASVKPYLPMLGFWIVALLAAWYFSLLWLVVVWWFSVVSSFWAIFRIRSWTEHQGVEGTHRFQVNPLTKFVLFPHNTWCHDEHHRWPYIPFYRLPEARKLTESRDKVMTLRELWDLFATVKEQPRREV